MRFRSAVRRHHARSKTAKLAARKLIDRFMTDRSNLYLTYHLTYLQRQQFVPRGSETDVYWLEKRLREFEERVIADLLSQGIQVESYLESDIRSSRFNMDKKYLRVCTLTVQRA